MALETLATTALGYLISSIKKSEGGKQASKEMSTAIWEWIRPIFLKDEEPINDLKNDPDDADNQNDVATKIKKHLKKNPESQAPLEQILKELAESGEKPAPTVIQNHYGTGDNIVGDKIINNNPEK